MGTRRTAKVSEAVRETVSTTILFDLKDPRVKNVTVLAAEVGADLRTAKVYVSVMGNEKEQSLTMHGLNSARGFIQAKLADRLQTRYTPVLTFVLDQGVKKSIEASRIIREALAESPPNADELETADAFDAADLNPENTADDFDRTDAADDE